MKYGIWNIGVSQPEDVRALTDAGLSPLTAAVLASRGFSTPESVQPFLSPETALVDPFLLKDMDAAVLRLRSAIDTQERVCVFGDYDVDGITSTCLLADYLASRGCDTLRYIPSRLEEGYGLNPGAITSLHNQGVTLIITVDCGITALEEAALCKALGVDLIITDHHECKEELPEAIAVVNPHRKDAPYPYSNLAGVGVAFKVAAALDGNQRSMLERYADLVCLGTVADVMPLLGENRCFVSAGLRTLQRPKRPGVLALMQACGCLGKRVTSSTIGFTLAPRINAAGRMGQVELATELFLTKDPARAEELVDALCRLNRQRQQVESEILADAVSQLDPVKQPSAIVLASETWHQGVVGIVASRLAEEYHCPVFLICLDGDKGKASSRSYGGFNLFASLDALSDLLESFGGHELAAGFTIRRDQIDAFRDAVTKRAEEYFAAGEHESTLQIDCEVPPASFTLQNVQQLDQLEPCGSGCPSPVFCLSGMHVDQASEVGGGKHLRLQLSRNGYTFGAIFFSNTAKKAAVTVGDCVDIAFTPQVNEYRGMKSVQFVLLDLRPDAAARKHLAHDTALYKALQQGTAPTLQPPEFVIPGRGEFVAVWKYLSSHSISGLLEEDCALLSRNIARFSGLPCSLLRTRICLDVFSEQGLLLQQEVRGTVHIRLTAEGKKADLNSSRILASLRRQFES